MAMTIDDVLAYAHEASVEECARLAKTFSEYSQIEPLFRSVWDMYKILSEDQKKIAHSAMESSLRTMYEIWESNQSV